MQSEHPFDSQIIRSRVQSFELAYLKSLSANRERYAAISEALPSFLQGERRIAVHMGRDGIVVVRYAAEVSSIEFFPSDDNVTGIVHTVSDGGFGFDFYPNEPTDISIAQPRLHKGEDTSGPVVWEAPWQSMRVTNQIRGAEWSETLGRLEASNDVQTFVASHLMELGNAQPPQVFDEISNVIAQFERLLDLGPREEEVQVFLTDNPILLAPDAAKITPKVKLGTEFITDYVLEMAHEEYVFVEIEPPGERLFTRAGDTTARLNHAIGQVRDWRAWIQDNVAYARQEIEELAGVDDPELWFVMGRRPESARDQRSLRRLSKDYHWIKVLTFDDLIERLRRHLGRLQSHRRS